MLTLLVLIRHVFVGKRTTKRGVGAKKEMCLPVHPDDREEAPQGPPAQHQQGLHRYSKPVSEPEATFRSRTRLPGWTNERV